MIDDHAHRHRVAEPGVVEDVAADLGADHERDDVERPAGQLEGRRLGAERVAEQQDHRPEDRRRQDRQGDVAPVLDADAPMFSAASRHSRFRPSRAGAMIRTISGNWKYM